MNDTTISRRQAIQAGTNYLGLLVVALLAAAVPQSEPALPDWLTDEPELAAAFERYTRVTRLLAWDEPGVPARLIDGWSGALETLAARLVAEQAR